MDANSLIQAIIHFATGGSCDTGQVHESDVTLYAKIEGRKDHITLDIMTYASYRVSVQNRS